MKSLGMEQKRQQALSDAIEEHKGKLRSVIGKRVRDQMEAEDILQEVFIEFVQAYDLGNAIEVLGSWLVTVAKNKILDRFRRRKTQEIYAENVKTSPEIPASKGPDEEWTQKWLRGEIVNAIELLPRDQREVFVKHELEGKSFEEIAAETGEKVNTLLSRKRYAVTFLREYLKEIYDGLEDE